MSGPVICASDKTHVAHLSGNQHSKPLYPTIGNIRDDIRQTPKMLTNILTRVSPCQRQGAKRMDEAWHSAVGTVLSQLRYLDISGPCLKWDWADGFQQRCYPVWAAWVGNYTEQVMDDQVICLMPNEHNFWRCDDRVFHFRPFDNSRDHNIHLELLEERYMDAVYTLGVHLICNQFWQYPFCNVYRLWQPDELHQLLLGLVKDILNWLLKHLKVRQVKDQFDNRFTLVPKYPGFQHFSEMCDWFKTYTLWVKEIHGMIITLPVNGAPFRVCSKDDRKSTVEKASHEMVMGAVWAVCLFSLLVSQQNHLDLSFNALDDAFKRFNQKNGIFGEQQMLKSANTEGYDLFAIESHQLCEQRIHKIHLGKEAIVYGVEMVSPTQHSQFQVCLNRAWQAATTWSDADRQKAIEHV